MRHHGPAKIHRYFSRIHVRNRHMYQPSRDHRRVYSKALVSHRVLRPQVQCLLPLPQRPPSVERLPVSKPILIPTTTVHRMEQVVSFPPSGNRGSSSRSSGVGIYNSPRTNTRSESAQQMSSSSTSDSFTQPKQGDHPAGSEVSELLMVTLNSRLSFEVHNSNGSQNGLYGVDDDN